MEPRRKAARSSARRLLLAAAAAATIAVVAVIARHWSLVRWWYRLRHEFALATVANTGGYPEFRHRRSGVLMVLLPGGVFTLGRAAGDPGTHYNETPAHEARLDVFLIGKYEVSQAEWERIMGPRESTFTGAELPVETLSWNECREFCAAIGLRLPTEAEWEYACRAGETAAYSTGSRLSRSEAHFGVGAGEDVGTLPVDSLPPNALGLHHMHGNVPEWCEDVYDSRFYGKAAARERNPLCTSGERARVIRGGGWVSRMEACRSAARSASAPEHDFLVVGFRVAYRPE